MTSSLVGSEMCIRDSDIKARNPERTTLCSSRQNSLDKINTEFPALAVSYTHLTLPTICSV
eukprot:9772239-Prorocentrum_lima.AAC.1